MRRVSQFALSAATAIFLVSSVAIPADARRYRHWDRHRGVDADDIILGAIIIGGIAVLVSEIGKTRDRDGGVYDRDGKRRANTESAAIDACSEAAEQRAADLGRSARVTDIRKVERDGDRFEVRGTIEYRSYGDWGNRDRDRGWRDTARFTCTYSYGRIDTLWVDDGYAWR